MKKICSFVRLILGMSIVSGLFFSNTSWSANSEFESYTEVAFLEKFYPNGKRVELVKGGRFYHSAILIRYMGQDRWLHAGPTNGVELVDQTQLEEIATITTVVKVPGPRLTYSEIQPYLDKKFDFYYGWGDDKIYCSELIAKIFGVPPVPMYFDPQLWPSNYWQFNGQPGISPDQLYQALLQMTRTP